MRPIRSTILPTGLKNLWAGLCALLLFHGELAFSSVDGQRQELATTLLSETMKGHVPGKALYIFEDRTKSLSYEEIQSGAWDKEFIRSNTDRPGFGFSNSTFWIKLYLENPLPRQHTIFLEFAAPLVDHVELFYENPMGETIIEKRGDREQLPLEQDRQPNHTFKLDLSPGKHLLVLKVRTEGSVKLPLLLWTEKEFSQHTEWRNYSLCFVYGIFCVMLVYNSFLAVILRSMPYFFYAVFTAFNIINYLCVQGMPLTLFEGQFAFLMSDYFLVIWNGVFTFGLLFSSSFLNLKERLPRVDKVFRLLIFFLLCFLPLGFVSYHLGITLQMTVSILSLIVLAFASIYSTMKKYRPAYFFTLAWGILIICVLVDNLSSAGLLQISVDTANLTFIGGAIEATLLSLALGDKFRTEQLESLGRIEALNLDLKEKEEARTVFFHNTSHELRTPLNGIIGFSDLLIAGHLGTHLNDIQPYAEKIRNLAKSLKIQVNTILDLAKSKRGELRLVPSSVELKELSEYASLLAEGLLLKSRNASFDLHFQADQANAGPFVTDREKVLTIIRNLLGNAFKFSQQGTPNTVSLSLSLNQERALVIVVADTGIGIPPDQVDSIFAEFKQVQGDSRRAYEGTGLGLAMVRSIVNLMGGRIDVTSKIDAGSRFEVALPEQKPGLVLESKDEPEVARGAPELSFKGKQVAFESRPAKVLPGSFQEAKTVLIIDDNEVNCEVIQEILKSQNYRTEVAYSGKDGLNRIQDRKPDLVLLDLMMPEMSGEDVLLKIRKDETLKDLAVILVTARASSDDKLYGLELGADDYLAKPIDGEELILRVRNTLARTDLIRAEERLYRAEKMAELGELMSELSHEISNIILPMGAENQEEKNSRIRIVLSKLPLRANSWPYCIEAMCTQQEAADSKQREAKLLMPEGTPLPLIPLRVIRRHISRFALDFELIRQQWEEILGLQPHQVLEIEGVLSLLRSLSMMETAGLRGSRLLHSVLSYSRENPGETVCNMAAVVESSLCLMERRLHKHDITIDNRIDVGRTLLASPSEVSQIILNILKNAVDALGASAAAPRTIELVESADSGEDSIVYTIQNNGGEIPAGILPRIFDKDFSTKGREGNGIGLYVSKRLAEKNHGSLRAESAQGMTRFHLTLKLSNPGAQSKRKTA
ncbi:ATP-binding protein [Oligoflexus tunisiensis]|uniref:ATP-binding protein n=1 Tax=Oligoflexus tunisiensis TaxID=708132 RepID=UPI000A6943D8|nr:ATP-binding protein [Oligoflexus tunisiensis]